MLRKIDECTAEVFRRSERRKEEQKRKRRRIWMCGIPALACCITLFSAVLLPGMMNQAKKEAPESSWNAGGTGEASAPYVRAEIRSAGDSPERLQSVTDQSKVAGLYRAIRSVWATGSAEVSGSENESGEPEMFSVPEYEIIFFTEQGEETGYLFGGNVLTDGATLEKRSLTPEQASELREALNLPGE